MELNTERLNDVYDFLIYKHIVKNQEDFASRLGTSRPNITNMLRGNVKVSDQILRKVYTAFPNLFSLDWLLTGQEQMIEGDDAPKNIVAHEEPRTLDQSSLINAALAAKDETIRSKDELIASLRETIDSLRQQISMMRNHQAGDIFAFPVGVAEEPTNLKSNQ